MSLGLTQPFVGTQLFPSGVTTSRDGSGKQSEETVAMSVSGKVSEVSVYKQRPLGPQDRPGLGRGALDEVWSNLC